MIRDNENLGCLLLLIPIVGWALILVAIAHGYAEIVPRQQTMMGTVVSHEPSNHNRYGYRFLVDGRDYIGSETPPGREPTIGQSVRIYYDPLDPSANGLTDFAKHRDSMLGPAIFILICCAGAAGVILLLGRPSEKRQAARPPAPPLLR